MRTSARRRVRLCTARLRDTRAMRERSTFTRCPIRRRSVSSCVSPGPRKPMPPFCRSRWVQPPARRVERCAELRELDLQLAFRAARAQREDVEDEARAVDDAAAELLLEVALLHAGERVVEDDEVGVRFAPARVDLVDLAAAGEIRGVGPRAASRDEAGHDGARGDRELVELALAVRAVVARRSRARPAARDCRGSGARTSGVRSQLTVDSESQRRAMRRLGARRTVDCQLPTVNCRRIVIRA